MQAVDNSVPKDGNATLRYDPLGRLFKVRDDDDGSIRRLFMPVLT